MHGHTTFSCNTPSPHSTVSVCVCLCVFIHCRGHRGEAVVYGVPTHSTPECFSPMVLWAQQPLARERGRETERKRQRERERERLGQRFSKPSPAMTLCCHRGDHTVYLCMALTNTHCASEQQPASQPVSRSISQSVSQSGTPVIHPITHTSASDIHTRVDTCMHTHTCHRLLPLSLPLS